MKTLKQNEISLNTKQENFCKEISSAKVYFFILQPVAVRGFNPMARNGGYLNPPNNQIPGYRPRADNGYLSPQRQRFSRIDNLRC